MKTDFESSNLGEFEDVFGGELFDSLREFGLLVL
jgi:hypothetical protein